MWFKNHFSSCCRSSWSKRQSSDRCRGRTPACGRSIERCHRPGRGRHSRSRSHSRSSSQTRNAHNIEIDWFAIDDIDILRTSHSISRSKTVAAISNDTDPNGKTQILTKLQVKLPYRNVADVMEVKVNDGPEVNILPLHTFRSMFPHKLDESQINMVYCKIVQSVSFVCILFQNIEKIVNFVNIVIFIDLFTFGQF